MQLPQLQRQGEHRLLEPAVELLERGSLPGPRTGEQGWRDVDHVKLEPVAITHLDATNRGKGRRVGISSAGQRSCLDPYLRGGPFHQARYSLVVLFAGIVILFKTVRMVPQGYGWSGALRQHTHTSEPRPAFLDPGHVRRRPQRST